MRAAVIFVLMSVLTAPSEASESCMTKTEARRHFVSVHIYWHGRDHCWDATPKRRHHQVQKVQHQVQKVQRIIAWPRWQNAMSEMLPDEEPVQAPLVDRPHDIEPSPIAARWVDIIQVVPPHVIESEPTISLRGVLIVIIIIIGLPLAIVGVLFGGRRSEPDMRIAFGSELDHDR
jgi:hypothetical protein